MKIVTVIAKILAALTAVVGAIYLLATYGEQIVAWCKKVMANLPECPKCCDECDEPVAEEEAAEEPAEEAEEVLEEVPVEEIPVEEPVAENEVVADETDFAE